MSQNKDIVNGSWQNDWNLFVDFLAKQLRGSSKEQLAVQFGCKQVVWSGVLVDKSLDELAPIVTIRMPVVAIDIDGLGLIDVHDQCVSCDRASVSEWDEIPLGARLSFTAVFPPKDAIFPPLEVKKLSSGRVLLFVRLNQGRPVASGD